MIWKKIVKLPKRPSSSSSTKSISIRPLLVIMIQSGLFCLNSAKGPIISLRNTFSGGAPLSRTRKRRSRRGKLSVPILLTRLSCTRLTGLWRSLCLKKVRNKKFIQFLGTRTSPSRRLRYVCSTLTRKRSVTTTSTAEYKRPKWPMRPNCTSWPTSNYQFTQLILPPRIGSKKSMNSKSASPLCILLTSVS